MKKLLISLLISVFCLPAIGNYAQDAENPDLIDHAELRASKERPKFNYPPFGKDIEDVRKRLSDLPGLRVYARAALRGTTGKPVLPAICQRFYTGRDFFDERFSTIKMSPPDYHGVNNWTHYHLFFDYRYFARVMQGQHKDYLRFYNRLIKKFGQADENIKDEISNFVGIDKSEIRHIWRRPKLIYYLIRTDFLYLVVVDRELIKKIDKARKEANRYPDAEFDPNYPIDPQDSD